MKCYKAQAQRAEPMISSPLPELPWQKVGTDLIKQKGHVSTDSGLLLIFVVVVVKFAPTIIYLHLKI
jgi:hypothetical protein